MKIIQKKILLSGVAVTVAGVLGVGALLQTSISVQASPAMMPGIEEIVNETSKDEPFRILEIVDSENEAELGYYISGQEPYIKLYKDENGNAMAFSSLEDGLSKLSEKQRREFATNKKIDENGNISYTGKNVENLCGDSEEEYPLAYSEYQEQYFVSSEEGWKRVDLVDADGNPRTDTVKIQGHYQENTAGNGQYTKEEQTYYPIRKNVTEDNAKTNKYRENIENFYYSDDEEAQAPYALTFTEVKNEDVNKALEDANDRGQTTILPEYDYSNGKYGYYENVYADLTEDIANNIQNKVFKFPGENPVVDESRAVLIQDNTPQGASAFTAGEEQEFSTVNDGNETSDVVPQSEFEGGVADNAGADAFSTGDFGDGTSDGGDTQNQTQQNNVPTAGVADELTDNAQTEEQASTGRTILLGFANEETKGTTENPYIYLGESIQAYPYYKYTLVGDLDKIKALALANQQEDEKNVENNTQIVRIEKDVTLEDGQYWYWKEDTSSGQLAKYPLSIVTGRQAVAYSDIKKIDSSLDYNYYYTVEKAYFCCEASTNDVQLPTDYQYYGWYYVSYPQGDGNTYIKVTEGDGKVATHYISDAEYKLTPETGDYDFVPDEQEPEQVVEVNHIFYQGGYVNHDWFKRYVFHLSPDDKEQFDNFDIKVDTITAQEFDEIYGSKVATADTGNAEAATDITDDTLGTDGISTDSETDSISDETQVEESQDGESDTSEVSPIVSEAGIELVSIENEINDNSTDEFQDGTDDVVTENDNAERQQEESVDIASETPNADFSDGESGDTDTFSAGESTTIADSELEKYDLIYVNGNLQMMSANVIVSLQVPCIVNSEKADNNDSLKSAFELFYTKEDSDRHYVYRYFYFFKNTYGGDESLLNIYFHKNFNIKNDDITDGTISKEVEGFEEILEYIESENQYRQIGDTFTDDNTSDSDQSDEKLLKNDLSQARAIEYIINYKYKRKLNTKSEINVLEIEPAKISDNEKLDKNTVRSWLAEDVNKPTIDSVEADCEQDNENAAKNIMNSAVNLIWHSAWNGANSHLSNGKNHSLTITLENAASVSGFSYTPRIDSINGKVRYFKITLRDAKGRTILKEETNEEPLYNSSIDYSVKKYTFKGNKTYKNVKTIIIEITEAYDDVAPNSISNRNASCAYLEFFDNEEANVNPTVTTMTASEYVGHIDDINSKYDMIYIGGKIGETRNELINGKAPMLYTHVGAAIKADDGDSDDSKKIRSLMGMLDIDYVGTSPNKFMQSTELYNTGENGEKKYPGLGSFRGSGNDMTNQQYLELMDFVKSGYPVVLADSLVEDGHASAKTVDNSSYYYKFIEAALPYSNVSTVRELKNTDLSFFAKLSKPVIEFTENGRPAEVPRIGEVTSSGNTGYLTGEDLRYEFTIKNDSDAYPVNSTYNCELFFDLNFDGNLSKLEEQEKYMQIQDESGNVLSKVDGVYQLQLGKKYIVTRKIPDDYFKVITWKLQITNNNNSSVRTSVIGYSKRQGKTPQTINVLQIMPKVIKNDKHSLSNWDLQSEWGTEGSTFHKLMAKVEDFQLNIETIDVDTYSANYKAYMDYKNDKTGTVAEKKDPLEDKQMIILGFGDVYQNIPNDNGEVDAIVKFIEDGKSVIFTHDTTSSINWDYQEFDQGSWNPRTENNKSIKDGFLWDTVYREDWGYSLNTLFRSISGLDRYGITNTKATSIKDGDTTISALLKRGQMLDSNDSNVDFEYMQEMSGDVAYMTNSGRSKSYMQTQGYTNNQLINKNPEVNLATKVNDGAITQYPYRLPEDGTLTVATTHGQYYQLALEKDMDINGVSDGKNDIVVWYCLGGTGYDNSPNDVRNNYYFYSRGNVIYTGVGHRTVNNEQEIKLFINAIVAAANVTAVKPDVNFVTELNPAAKVEKTRYYVTDQTSWNQDEINLLKNDQEFFINVKDYNMVSSSLSLEDKRKEDMKVDFYIGGTEETNKINNIIGQMIPYGNDVEPVNLATDGSFHVKNNAYRITLSNIEQYLRDSGGNYVENCRLYVKVTSTVSLYGKNTTSVSEAFIDLKQRQLFELD